MPLAAGNHATAARLNALGRLVAETTWTTDSSTYTTSEVMLKSLTFTAVTGVTYLVMVDAGWSITSQSTTTFRIRAAGGASVTTSGSVKYSRKWRAHEASAFDNLNATSRGFSDITPSSGQITVGLSALADSGTGRLEADADNVGWMGVFAVGLA